MRQLLRSVRFLTSRKLAVYILAAVALIAAATQIPFFLEKGIDKIVLSSWWFNGLLLLQVLNTLVCTLFRMEKIERKPGGIPAELVKYHPNYCRVETQNANNLLYFVKDHLSRKRYKIYDLHHERFLAYKGNSYYWGSILFHISFLIIVIGLILNNFFGFHGNLIVAARQIVNEDHVFYQNIKEGVMFGEQHQHFQIGLEDINVSFDPGKNPASVLEAKVWLMESHRRLVANETVKPNQPVRYKGRRILLTGFGYSPYFTLEHRGKEIFQQHINLMTTSGKSNQLEFKDTFTIPNSQIKVQVRLFPHATFAANGKLTTVTNNLELPAVEIRVTQRGKVLYAGNAFMGQTMKLSNGMKLNFQGVKRYGWFDVAYNPGVYFVYGGFILCLLGLIFALFVTPRRIWVSTSGNGLEVAGCSKRYQQLFREEFNGFAALLSEEEAVKDDIINDL
ncbi:MAG TPA: cytochrome c biogenesis protein ResB [Desulfobacteria bacterium]|nr:cytochrome c biogenesis protein ResB [Desulfobacteria bacterium]